MRTIVRIVLLATVTLLAAPTRRRVAVFRTGLRRTPSRCERSGRRAARPNYAIGVAFGAGEFIANDHVDGKWINRTYTVDATPEGSLESWFMAGVSEPSVTDPRGDSGDADVEPRKLAGHGQRWFGGYKVPENVRELTQDANNLMPAYSREAFDALNF